MLTDVKNTSSRSGTFVYDASGVLVEECSGGTVQTSYVYAGSTLLTTETSSGTNYLTADHLGSPRIVTDASGNVTSRKDYTVFGEETFTAQRTTGLGYTPRNIRQDYTGYQKDSESGLEYAQARYYNPLHGRFTSVDPLTASATIRDPQSFNRYSYSLNSPYKFTDPLGLISSQTGACGQWCKNGEGNLIGIGSVDHEDIWGNFLPETITLELNIVYEKTQYSEKEASEMLKDTIEDLNKTFSSININFDITFTPGTGKELDNESGKYYRIYEGAKDNVINVFLFKNKVKQRSETYNAKPADQIMMSHGWDKNDGFRVGALAHEMGHLLLAYGGREVSNLASNGIQDAEIELTYLKMRNGTVKYGRDYVDDFRTERDIRVIPGGGRMDIVRVPTIMDIFRLGARNIANR